MRRVATAPMKLRSAQFVLLVLLFSSLSLSEGSSLRLADELIGSAVGIRLAPRTLSASVAEPASPGIRLPAASYRLAPAGRTTLAGVWSMREPAAHSALIQATTGNARA
jgi:hypothetical protein